MSRIGILGVAHLHVDAYVPALRELGAEVVGAWDHDAERGARWAAGRGIPFFAERGRLLDALDGVVVASETVHHRGDVEAAAAAGAAVLCEKPLATTREDSAAIVEACHAASVTLMTAFPARFAPAMRHLRDLVLAGELGRVRAFSGTNQSVMPMRDRAWFVDPALAGGGAIMDHVVHLADLYSWMLEADPLTAYAVANRIVHAETVTVETSGLVMLTYPGEVFASIDCSWNRPEDYPSWGGLALSLIADGGTVEVDPHRQRLVQFGGGRDYSWRPWGLDTSRLMIGEFLDAIADGRPPLVTGEDGDRATRVALAALESIRTGDAETC